jgi:peptidylprolyl isomerase
VPTEKRQRKKQGHAARMEAARLEARRQQRKRRRITMAIAVVVVFAVAFAVSLTGNDKKKDASATKKATTTTTAAGPTTTTLPPTKVNPADKPKIDVPTTPAPTTLVVKDVKVGDGAVAKLGDSIEVSYVGVKYADGTQFDASWDRGETIRFDLVEGGLIKGWTDGIPGMKVGGRRELIIPGPLAYGDADTGDGRPHGALIFVIDLVSIS